MKTSTLILASILILIAHILISIAIIHYIEKTFFAKIESQFLYIEEPFGDAEIDELIKKKIVLEFKPA